MPKRDTSRIRSTFESCWKLEAYPSLPDGDSSGIGYASKSLKRFVPLVQANALANIGAGHRMVTKLGPLCRVKLLKKDGDKLVVRSPEKAGVGGQLRPWPPYFK